MITDKQREYLKNIYVWIEQDARNINCFRVWMCDRRDKWGIPGYLSDCYFTAEDCLKELTERYGEEVVEEMDIVIHTTEMKNKGRLIKTVCEQGTP